MPLVASPELARSPDARAAFAPVVPTTVPSLLILGTDAVLAAAPATPVQLAHACMAAGFHTVIPVTWGDELIASRVIERLRDADVPLVQCSCPYVARRLATHGDAIAPMLASFVSPPIATAQYLRAAYAPSRPHITYAGGCPAASHDIIDVWLSVDELKSTLAERGVSASTQPTEFDSVIPPDRRRYFSEPGGVPSRHALRQLSAPVDLVELQGDDVVVDLAQQLLSGSRALVDLAVPLGCCCSGATGSVGADAARARVRDQEPPRALSPVVDHSMRLALDGPPLSAGPPVAREVDPAPKAMDQRSSQPPEVTLEAAMIGADPVTRRRSPPGLSRPVLGAMPLRRSEAGRQLPRAYVARRRSSPHGLRQSSVRSEGPSAPQPERRQPRLAWIVAAGVAIGLGIALLLRLVF